MKDPQTTLSAAFIALLTLGITTISTSARSAIDDERCYGVIKAGQNACNTSAARHSCSGQSKIDGDKDDYLPLPKGTCLKIGGKLNQGGSKAGSAKNS